MPTLEEPLIDVVSVDYERIRETRKRINWHRAASGIVFVLYFYLLVIFTVTFEPAVELALIQIVPLAAVWFGDEMAAMTDVDLDKRFDLVVTTASPGDIIRITGWLWLLLSVAAFMLGLLMHR